MKILHIVKKRNDVDALAAASRQREQGHDVSILLAHDGVLSDLVDDFAFFACEDDVLSRGVRPSMEILDYAAIIRLIFDHDSAVTW